MNEGINKQYLGNFRDLSLPSCSLLPLTDLTHESPERSQVVGKGSALPGETKLTSCTNPAPGALPAPACAPAMPFITFLLLLPQFLST